MNNTQIATFSVVTAGTLTLAAIAAISTIQAHQLKNENARLRRLDKYKQKWIEKIVDKYVTDEMIHALYEDVVEETTFLNIVNNQD